MAYSGTPSAPSGYFPGWYYSSSQLEPNACTYATSDALEDPNFDFQGTEGFTSAMVQNTIMGGMDAGVFTIGGLAAKGPANTVLRIGNSNPTSLYDLTFNGSGGSGLLIPPNAIDQGGTQGGGQDTFHDLIHLDVTPTTYIVEAGTANAGQTQVGLAALPWGQLLDEANSGNYQFHIANAGLTVQNFGTFGQYLQANGFLNLTSSGGGDANIQFNSGNTGPTPTKMGLLNANPFAYPDNDLALFTGSRSTYVATPNVNLWLAQLNATNVADTALTSGIVGANSGGLLGTITALPNGTTATTQTAGDNTTQVATDAFVQSAITFPSYYWNLQPSLFATSTTLGAIYYLPNGLVWPSLTLELIARLAGTISCSGAPVVSLLDLGTSATTAYGSATVIASLTTGTSDGIYTSGSGAGSIGAGHYLGMGFSGGACTTPPTIDLTVTI
jgi:hypothetical protein